jgi:DNA primase
MPLEAARLPWARYGSRSWAETGHRLIVPVYDHAGRLALVRGWRWEPDDSPKRLAAAGCSVRGLVVAGGLGLQLLRGELPEWIYPARVVIEEGEPDTLAATLRWPGHCVIGIVPGCWCPELAARIPAGAEVLIRTDPDEAGERYAQQIAESLRGRCGKIERVLRG